MLPTETTEIIKYILNLSEIEQQRILKTYELLIYGDTHYFTDTLCKNELKIATP
jgi:hypothetical protein